MKRLAAPFAFLLVCASSARADTTYNFGVNGSGITSSGSLTVALSGGTYEITGISGSFGTTSGTPFAGAITGLLPSTYNASSPVSVDGGTLNYDNIFYPAGSPPSACSTGVAAADRLDLCGLAFLVTSNSMTYDVNLYGAAGTTAGYQVLDTVHGSSLVNQANAPVNVTFTAATPEPSTWFLTATGMLATAGAWKRRRSI